MRIYVGNLSYEATEQNLRQKFEAYGGVDSVSVITDRYSGRSKGFAFIEMASKSEGETAITNLNGDMLNDRNIVVNEARPRIDNRGGGSYSGGYGNRDGRPGRGRQQRRY